MAEEEKEEQEESKEGKKGGNLVLIIIIVVLVLLLVVGGLAAFFLLSSNDEEVPMQEAQTMQAPSKKSAQGRKKDLTIVGPMYPLDKFIVNLQSENGGRFLKVSMNIELSSEELQAEIDSKVSVIRDIVIRTLSSKTFEEISTIKGKDRLKDELVDSINEILADGHLNNVYFTDFVIQ